MHAEVARAAGAPASLRQDKGWAARFPPVPMAPESKALPGRRSRRLVSHFQRPGGRRDAANHVFGSQRLLPKAKQVRRSSSSCTLPSPRARGTGQGWGSRNALSTRETEPTGSLMESNQSQALESPIAMAAEFPESDKAHSPSLPSRPCPLFPFPCAAAARSRAQSALRRVNHCKNKEMKGSPVGELLAALSRALEEDGTARAELPR